MEPIYSPTCSEPRFPFIRIPSRICYLFVFSMVVILTDVEWHLTVVFIFIPGWSVTLSVCSHTSCPFDYLLWKKQSIQVLCSLNMDSFVIWIACSLLSCINSLQILDISRLSDIWFTNIFFHLVGDVFMPIASFVVQSLLVWHSPALWSFTLLRGLQVSYPQDCHPDPCAVGPFPGFHLGILLPQVFQILHADLQHMLRWLSECLRNGLSCVAWHVVR